MIEKMVSACSKHSWKKKVELTAREIYVSNNKKTANTWNYFSGWKIKKQKQLCCWFIQNLILGSEEERKNNRKKEEIERIPFNIWVCMWPQPNCVNTHSIFQIFFFSIKTKMKFQCRLNLCVDIKLIVVQTVSLGISHNRNIPCHLWQGCDGYFRTLCHLFISLRGFIPCGYIYLCAPVLFIFSHHFKRMLNINFTKICN